MTPPVLPSEAPSIVVILSEAPSQLHRDGAQSRNPRISALPLPVPSPSPTPKLSALLLILLTLAAPRLSAEPPTVRIAVLTLFNPHTLVLTSARPAIIHLNATTLLLPGNRPLTLRSSPGGITAELPNAAPIVAEALTLPPSTFTLTVPGKLTRTYIGSLVLTTRYGTLLPILIIDTELAVASILAAEAPSHASLEALKAQAIVSRSYLLAHSSAHSGFDACDTTHCQFLRSPPPLDSPFTAATEATRDLVLTWRASPTDPPRIVPAMYSRSCGGRTRAHPTTPSAYPFYAVSCAFCLRHPELWTRPATTAPIGTERQRLAFNRTHGWSAIPSNDHTSSPSSLQGRGTGHGIGLCQLGAQDLALRGSTCVEILSHFFPNTSLTLLP